MIGPVGYHITTRAGGVSTGPFTSLNLAYHVGDDPDAVRTNRHRLAVDLGLPDDHIIWMDQTHSTHIHHVSGPTTESISNTDGLVSTHPGLALAVLTADCVPVLLADPVCGIIGAIHAGRCGVVHGIIPAALETMTHLGAHPHHIHALLGPAISPQHYELPALLVNDVEHTLPGSRSQTLSGAPSIDLHAGITTQLHHHGITHIHRDHRCTYQDSQLFSYRRNSHTGRFASLIWLTHQASL